MADEPLKLSARDAEDLAVVSSMVQAAPVSYTHLTLPTTPYV